MKAVYQTAQVQLILIRVAVACSSNHQDPELANAEPLLPGEVRDSVPASLSDNVFVN